MVSIYICQKFFGDVNVVSYFVLSIKPMEPWNFLKTPNLLKNACAKKKHFPGDSKCPFHPLVGGHLTPSKGHVFTIPKRSRLESLVLFVVVIRLSFLKRPKSLLERYQRFLTESYVDVGAPQIRKRTSQAVNQEVGKYLP